MTGQDAAVVIWRQSRRSVAPLAGHASSIIYMWDLKKMRAHPSSAFIFAGDDIFLTTRDPIPFYDLCVLEFRASEVTRKATGWYLNIFDAQYLTDWDRGFEIEFWPYSVWSSLQTNFPFLPLFLSILLLYLLILISFSYFHLPSFSLCDPDAAEESKPEEATPGDAVAENTESKND